MHLSHQGPVLVDCGPGLGSQVQERAGAAATAPADSLDDLGVGVGQLRQRAPQLLLVSAGVITSEGAGRVATTPPSGPASATQERSSSVCEEGAGGTAPLIGRGSPQPEAPGATFPASDRVAPGCSCTSPLRSGVLEAACLCPQIRVPKGRATSVPSSPHVYAAPSSPFLHTHTHTHPSLPSPPEQTHV